VNLGSLEIVGSYRTPPSAGFLGGYVQGFGDSHLRGHISQAADGSGTIISGHWHHTEGSLGNGAFEVRWHDETGTMLGWWAETNGARHDWIWKKDVGLASTAHHFVHSIWMARFTILVVCFVFLGTAVQSGLAIWPLGDIGNKVNLALMSMYGLLFGSFFPAYWFMYQRPTHVYMFGMFFFTVGYMIFAAYYGTIIYNVASASVVLYISGALFFAIASLCLVLATWPKGSDTSVSLFKKEAALFWGSALFLIGSVAFTIDAVYVLSGQDYTQWLGIAGNVLFDIGLFYFLWACTTPDVGFFVVPLPDLAQALSGSAEPLLQGYESKHGLLLGRCTGNGIMAKQASLGQSLDGDSKA
jgi:hypothetical protein